MQKFLCHPNPDKPNPQFCHIAQKIVDKRLKMILRQFVDSRLVNICRVVFL